MFVRTFLLVFDPRTNTMLKYWSIGNQGGTTCMILWVKQGRESITVILRKVFYFLAITVVTWFFLFFTR